MRIPGWRRSKHLLDLTRDDLVKIARYESEKITNEAIHRWNATHD